MLKSVSVLPRNVTPIAVRSVTAERLRLTAPHRRRPVLPIRAAVFGTPVGPAGSRIVAAPSQTRARQSVCRRRRILLRRPVRVAPIRVTQAEIG